MALQIIVVLVVGVFERTVIPCRNHSIHRSNLAYTHILLMESSLYSYSIYLLPISWKPKSLVYEAVLRYEF